MRWLTSRRNCVHTVGWVLRSGVIALAVYGGLDLARGALADGPSTVFLPYAASAQEVATLEDRVARLEDLLVHVSRDGNDLYVTGANLHVLNGSGATDGITNGLGNVVIGYNEPRLYRDAVNERGGSHMLVLGSQNNYTGFGGMVAGHWNTAAGAYSTVSGGYDNAARGETSSVSGGWHNLALGKHSSVSGGAYNEATGKASAASGGSLNVASGDFSSVSGGQDNTASSREASVSGGSMNDATGRVSAVCGGSNNLAGGVGASVTGGWGCAATGDHSSVSGGFRRVSAAQYGWRAGELIQER